MLSHQLKQHVIDGEKTIIQNPTDQQRYKTKPNIVPLFSQISKCICRHRDIMFIFLGEIDQQMVYLQYRLIKGICISFIKNCLLSVRFLLLDEILWTKFQANLF